MSGANIQHSEYSCTNSKKMSDHDPITLGGAHAKAQYLKNTSIHTVIFTPQC